MILNRIDDPRDALQKATRHELSLFAKEIGQFKYTFMGQQWQADLAPANITRAYLRSIGQTRIRVPNRPLGSSARPTGEGAQNVQQINAEADMARQFASQSNEPLIDEPKPPMKINELRAEAKRLGIKLDRKDTMDSMRAKIEAVTNGKNAA